MPDNDWVWLKLARLRLTEARFGALSAAQRRNRSWAESCARDAEQCLQRVWEEGTLPLRGVPTGPGSHEAVEIPASEAGNHWLDCPGSRIFRGRGPGLPRLMDYRSVQVRKADVERLAREAGGNGAVAETQAQAAPPDEGAAAETGAQAAPPDEGAAAPDAQEADTKPQTTAPEAPEAGKLARAVAGWLRHLFPDGRPAMRLEELAALVRKEAGKRLGDFRLTTLKRAIRLAWPSGQTGPERAKPGQDAR
jgi:hypothetical protein